MHYFAYKKNNLYCENTNIAGIVDRFGTPLYIYSARTIVEHFHKIKKAFSVINPLICYSVKANSNIALLQLLVDKGAGLDIVSGGELHRAKKAGCLGSKIVYASVGKTEKELRNAAKYGILMFNVESRAELARINHVAYGMGKRVNVALRLNPDVEPSTHAYITTAKKENKFGMDIDSVKNIFLHREAYPHLNIIGIHLHIGSQITSPGPYVAAIRKAGKLLRDIAREGVHLEYFNIGGGLGIVYDKEKPQTAQEFANKIMPLLKSINLKVILEPGRFIMGNAGIVATKVLYVKNSYNKQFIIVDAAMNDLIRPSLYGAYHKIIPLCNLPHKAHGIHHIKKADIVGPICESGDFLGKDRKITAQEGDYLAVLGAGAYGFSMSSNYNSRPRTAEVLVKGRKIYLIRERETYQDLTAKERFAF